MSNNSNSAQQQQSTYNANSSYPKANNANGSLINGGMSSADLSGGQMANGTPGGEEGMGGQAMSENGGGGGSTTGTQEYTLRARALYACQSRPRVAFYHRTLIYLRRQTTLRPTILMKSRSAKERCWISWTTPGNGGKRERQMERKESFRQIVRSFPSSYLSY